MLELNKLMLEYNEFNVDDNECMLAYVNERNETSKTIRGSVS